MMPSKSNTTAASELMPSIITCVVGADLGRPLGGASSAPTPLLGPPPLLGPQRNHRIDGRRAERRQIAGRNRNERQEQRGADEAEGIGGTHVVQKARHQARDAERASDA